MRNNQAGDAFLKASMLENTIPQRAFRLYVERAGQVVKDQQFGLTDEHARRRCAAVALPPDVVSRAQERGRARDLWTTVEELLAELEYSP
jgi:hypothetical protein